MRRFLSTISSQEGVTMNVRRVLSVLTATMFSIGTALAIGGPANAAGPDTCPDRYICIYQDANWARMIASWNAGETGTHNIPSNRASSWQNHGSYNWCAWDSYPIPDVKMFSMPAGQSKSYVGAYANDRVDYAKRC
jgi:hypothetical protein